MKFFVSLAIFLLAGALTNATNVIVLAPDKQPLKILKAPSGREFAYIQGNIPKKDARKACSQIDAKLADLISDTDYTFLAQTVEGGAWINTFDGKILGPMALWSGGAVSAPHRDKVLSGVLCELEI